MCVCIHTHVFFRGSLYACFLLISDFKKRGGEINWKERGTSIYVCIYVCMHEAGGVGGDVSLFGKNILICFLCMVI